MKVFTKKHLLDALAKEGLPATYKSLLKYEKLGIIPTQSNVEGVGSAGNWRLYTEDDIKTIVAKVKEHKTKNA